MSGRTRKRYVYLRRDPAPGGMGRDPQEGILHGGVHRRVRARRGHQKAIMALAHHMLTVIYHMLRDHQPYREPGATYYEEKRKPEITRRMVHVWRGLAIR